MPPVTVAATSAGPAVPDGTVTVIDVDVLAVMAALAPPMVTEVAPERSAPPRTTELPPAVGPESGVTDEMVGPLATTSTDHRGAGAA